MDPFVNTRREFLQKGLVLLAAAPTVPTFLSNTVFALSNPADASRTQLPTGRDGKILVVVQLSGGNDGLNTVVPYADDEYRRHRPLLGIDPKSVLKIDNYLGLHPNLAPLKNLYDNGKMAVIQGVGYPNPNRSHFRSMDIWHTAAPEKEIATTGWLGRYFDNTCAGDDPRAGISIGQTLPLAMQGEKVHPLAFERPDAYRYNGHDAERYALLNAHKEPATQPVKLLRPAKAIETTPATQLEYLTRTAMDAQPSSDEILKVTHNHAPSVVYPANEFGNSLKTIAAMIRGELRTRVYYASLGGFDTHANERNRHDTLMGQLAEGLAAFWKDLSAQKNDQRVLVMTFSEFGRRVEQNASGGTDHGAAAPMFLLGNSIKQGLIGKHPSLQPRDLDKGDLRYGTDFRSVYATVLQNWLETPSKPILGAQFDLLPVLKA